MSWLFEACMDAKKLKNKDYDPDAAAEAWVVEYAANAGKGAGPASRWARARATTSSTAATLARAGAMEVGLAVAAAAAALEAQVASCAAQLEALGGGAKPKKGSKEARLDELGEAIFDDVFCKRYRDVHARVRVAVVERLGKWIARAPSTSTRYLKYVAGPRLPEGAERAAAAGALARAFGAVDDATREALGDFAARFARARRWRRRRRGAGRAVGALDACMDCGLLAELDLGEDDVADVTDKVYSKIVDEDAAPELRAACLGLALKYEDFDVARAGGDGAKTLHDLGRFVEAADGARDDGDARGPRASPRRREDARRAPRRVRRRAPAVLAEAQDGVNGAKSLRSDLDRDAWAALHAAQLRAAVAAAGGPAPGLRRKRGFAALALPVDDDRDLAALAADVVWRHGAAALGATPARPTPKHYASSWKAATKDASPARLVLEPALQFVAGGRPDTPQREDLFAAVLAVAAAAEESEILAAAAEALAAHPDDAATVHLRALDRVAALLGADDGDEDEHEAARDAVADLAALAGAPASFGDDAAAATDALHGVLHGGLDAAFANPPASLAGLAGLLPYVADGRKNAKSARARRDAGLRASPLAEDGADSDSDDEPIMPAARRAYSGDAGHITTDDDDDDADAADRKRRRSWMPAAPLEEEEDDDDDEDESPPPKKKPASRRGRK
ncbi:hypothetical protein JL721_7812 [Aureococcus anophagefferens]|nr:hypothetical protein JL721_7812 [Aureococcus anophagefferens]